MRCSKLAGGAWLVYLGWRVWRDAKRPLDVAADRSASGDAETPAGKGKRMSAFMLGFITQVSNPKTSIVYASVFAALLPHDISWALFVLLPPIVFVIEAGWYALVAIGLSSAGPRAAYARSKAWIDRLAGGALALLGAKMIAAARHG